MNRSQRARNVCLDSSARFGRMPRLTSQPVVAATDTRRLPRMRWPQQLPAEWKRRRSVQHVQSVGAPTHVDQSQPTHRGSRLSIGFDARTGGRNTLARLWYAFTDWHACSDRHPRWRNDDRPYRPRNRRGLRRHAASVRGHRIGWCASARTLSIAGFERERFAADLRVVSRATTRSTRR